MQQVELVNQAKAFQQIEGAIDRHARDVRVNFLSAIQDFSGVHVAGGGFHHLEHHPALARQANPSRTKLVLQAAGGLVIVDAFAGRNAM
jgi:hypothetical protein